MTSPYGGGSYSDAPYPGAFASPVLGQNLQSVGSYASALGSWRAGPDGLLQGQFAWGNPATGLAYNAPQTPADVLGVVVPLQSVNGANGGVVGGPAALGGPQARWTWQTWDPVACAWRLRGGLMVTLAPTGAFYLRFASGANYGDTVYASETDGSAISGAASGAVETPFVVCQNVGPGELAIVSSTAQF